MTQEQIMLLILGVVVAISLVVFLIKLFVSPFSFPYRHIDFDITSKRQPDISDYIDQFLIDYGLDYFNDSMEYLKYWQSKCEEKIDKSLFKKLRRKQYLKVLDIDGYFVFRLYRMQTRYTQRNYVRSSYKVKNIVHSYSANYNFINERYIALSEINFECTLSNYFSKQQRKLMTKELRDKIAIRDNYTCQKCGKYMPDSVGLHIDHIVPISKGGKSIPSNLQVLCSKCNGAKSSRI